MKKNDRKGELFPREFMRGQRACQKGEECPANESDDFIRGYNAQYQMDQIKSEMGAGNAHN